MKKCRPTIFPTEKILVSEWPKTAQMALNFFFSESFLNMFRIFLFVKTIFVNLFVFRRVFLIKIQKLRKVQLKMKLYRPCINFYIKSFSASTNMVVVYFCTWMVECYTALRFINLMGNINT